MSVLHPVIEWSERVGAELEQVHNDQRAAALQLPNGARLFVCSLDDLSSLHAILNDPMFAKSLRQSVVAFQSGKGTVRSHADRPTEARELAASAVKAAGFAESLERASVNFANGQGVVRRSDDRPL